MPNFLYKLSTCLILLVSFCCAEKALAQTPPSDLQGEALRTWLKQNYYNGKHTTLDYSQARKLMYAYIDNVNDTIRCVYSGYKRYLPYGTLESYPAPINTEHTVPQSFFDENLPMVSDLHHLFPTYEQWNSNRGNLPFEEIPDSQTDLWMRGNQGQSAIPTQNIDEYSERENGGVFEPREDHKGDLARSVFYFYTMYPQVGNINAVADTSTLCEWAALDPVSQKETNRNDAIEIYQGNANPYVRLPDLIVQAWGCPSTASSQAMLPYKQLWVSPNPIDSKLNIRFETNERGENDIELMNALGLVVRRHHCATSQVELDTAELPQGIYFLRIHNTKQQAIVKLVKTIK
jgi:hypothetical protein